MIVDSGVMTVARPAHVGRDPFAPEEDLDGARSQLHLDVRPGVTIRHRVEMLRCLDVIGRLSCQLQPRPARLLSPDAYIPMITCSRSGSIAISRGHPLDKLGVSVS
jgi:hypothetical protein